MRAGSAPGAGDIGGGAAVVATRLAAPRAASAFCAAANAPEAGGGGATEAVPETPLLRAVPALTGSEERA